MTAPIVERVARAQCLACGLDPDFEVWDLNERKYRPYWTVRIPEARASILAMREPTEAMLAAGMRAYDTSRDIWAAMIDEALKDTPC